MWEIKKNLVTDPILEWEIVKKCRKYKTGDKYCNLCMEEKLAITSFNNTKEILYQKSEIFKDFRHEKS